MADFSRVHPPVFTKASIPEEILRFKDKEADNALLTANVLLPLLMTDGGNFVALDNHDKHPAGRLSPAILLLAPHFWELPRLVDTIHESEDKWMIMEGHRWHDFVAVKENTQEFFKLVMKDKLGLFFRRDNSFGSGYTTFSRLFAIMDELRKNERFGVDLRFADCLKKSYDLNIWFEERGVDLKASQRMSRRCWTTTRRTRNLTFPRFTLRRIDKITTVLRDRGSVQSATTQTNL